MDVLGYREKKVAVNKASLAFGHILVNKTGEKHVRVFSLFGRVYTTNKNRKRPYSMDDPYWEVEYYPELTFGNFFIKIALILEGAHANYPNGKANLTPSKWRWLKQGYPKQLEGTSLHQNKMMKEK